MCIFQMVTVCNCSADDDLRHLKRLPSWQTLQSSLGRLRGLDCCVAEITRSQGLPEVTRIDLRAGETSSRKPPRSLRC